MIDCTYCYAAPAVACHVRTRYGNADLCAGCLARYRPRRQSRRNREMRPPPPRDGHKKGRPDRM